LTAVNRRTAFAPAADRLCAGEQGATAPRQADDRAAVGRGVLQPNGPALLAQPSSDCSACLPGQARASVNPGRPASPTQTPQRGRRCRRSRPRRR